MHDNATSTLAAVYSRASSDPRVLVADGYGIKVYVDRGHLVICDGIGRHRRERRLPRIERSVRRLVILADTGYITLEAARWCADIGLTIIQVDRTGRLISVVAAPEPADARLRRAQVFAGEGGPYAQVGLEITQRVLAVKLDGQARIADELLNQPATAAIIRECADRVASADTVDTVRSWEGAAAGAYWTAWTGRVTPPFHPRDLNTMPAHWCSYPGRDSAIRATARHATDPVNALLNYGYRLAEIECRLACLTLGLDPAFGFLHADAPRRDSLALDLLETIRPDVDRHVLALLGVGAPPRYLSPKLFHETRDGVCRLIAPLTHQLAEQALTWARLVAPHTEHLARTLASIGKGEIRPGTPLTKDKILMRTPKRACVEPAGIPHTTTVADIVPDHLWHAISGLIPHPAQPHPRRSDDRAVLAGVICVKILGTPWTKIPPSLGVSRRTCRERWEHWCTHGIWPELERTIREHLAHQAPRSKFGAQQSAGIGGLGQPNPDNHLTPTLASKA